MVLLSEENIGRLKIGDKLTCVVGKAGIFEVGKQYTYNGRSSYNGNVKLKEFGDCKAFFPNRFEFKVKQRIG